MPGKKRAPFSLHRLIFARVLFSTGESDGSRIFFPFSVTDLLAGDRIDG
jgi:hypothetical protein